MQRFSLLDAVARHVTDFRRAMEEDESVREREAAIEQRIAEDVLRRATDERRSRRSGSEELDDDDGVEVVYRDE